MADQSDAIEALYTAIAELAPKITSDINLHTTSKARGIADLAAAYRYAAGGQQPGHTVIEK